MDVLWFQRDRSGFLPPDKWRTDAVAMTTTHDLPTAAGWWQGADLDLRRDFGLVGAKEAEQRELDRGALWRAFTTAGVAVGPRPQADQTEPVVHAAVGFVSKTPAPLALVALEDVMGLVEQPNLPGTTHEHPNWRRRFAMAAPDLLLQPAAQRRLELLGSRKS
jgi:4-alpha-glucanotransferase